MPKGTRTCKVCGKEYVYCKTFRPSGTFHWQDVACSPEHGSIYFERISASRSKKNSKSVKDEQNIVKPMQKAAKDSSLGEETIVNDTIIACVQEEATESQTTVAVSESSFDLDELEEIIDSDEDIDYNDEEEDYYDDDDEDIWFDDDEDDWLDDDEDELFDGKEWNGEETFILVNKQ